MNKKTKLNRVLVWVRHCVSVSLPPNPRVHFLPSLSLSLSLGNNEISPSLYGHRRSVNSRPPLATTFLNRRHADDYRRLAGLAFMFSSSILLQILACAIYGNWWPMLSALMYVVVPMPCMFFGGGSTQFLISRDGGGWIDAAKFLTGASTVGSLAIPIILRHAGMIETGAMLIEFTSFFIFICTVMCFHRASLDDDW
ncbi:vacuolar protein sorting-associated protein 55 homolog isoform X1 [Brassica rapa]|uniref:vacuolar protein sorting-associated protein 55 homolog isoform X1 n=1 Tax=Brassica campestris TaxID=3711 RepID=UPI00142E3FF7|nr:vacuolar protein sorting-associated protein 55 homolog isoform X1 [Brassica rapa]